MILYLDTSALVKRYIIETETPAVAMLVAQAERIGTSLITRATFDRQLWQAGEVAGLVV